jgi:alcohol dehydrogenase, propanol-preferring
MRAYQMTGWQQSPEFRDVEVPEPRPGQVLIKVAGAGACHSDLHLMEWPPGTFAFPLPFTLGHENTGWVEALGAGVEGLKPGEPVAVYGPWGCGRCSSCRKSGENLCENAAQIGALGGGLGRDGGFAPFMLVPAARLLIPLGDLDPVEAAPLTDAGLTPYHAIKRNLHKLVPGSSVAVIGVGGLGHMAVQILHAVSAAQVIAVDIDERKLDVARQVGATGTVGFGADAAAQIRDLTRGSGVDVVLDVVGTDQTMALAAAVIRPAGEVTVIGLAGGTFPFRFGALPFDSAITVPYWGSAVELMEVLELARGGKIRAHVQRFPLSQVTDVYQRLRQGDINGRAVITPQEP